MQRKEYLTLCSWLTNPQRKPLIIRGARQVGKTWLVRYLASANNKQLIELNFERNPHLLDLFYSNDPQKILLAIEAAFSISIDPEHSILFLDEIQVAPHLLAKLRWFAEKMPNLPVIAAGSLLEFVLAEHTFSMPVGRISYLHLEPLSFQEFLLATGHNKLDDFLKNYQLQDTIPQVLHEKLWELMREYIIVGGMPAVVTNWLEHRSLNQISQIQYELLATYRDDFAKYRGKIDPARLEETLNAIPRLIGKKFKYAAVNPQLQAISIKKDLELLCKARLCYKVQSSAANGIPLASEINNKNFKIILLDIGLVSSLLDLSLVDILKIKDLQLINQGSITEQLVGQLLRSIRPSFQEPSLYYWLREQTGSAAEIDYLIQHKNKIIPIEVKAGNTGTLRSLHLFMELKTYHQAVRINADLPSLTTVQTKLHNGQEVHYELLSIPLYLTEQLHRLLNSVPD